MAQPQQTLAPRKTIAVTVAGVLYLAWALLTLLGAAVFAFPQSMSGAQRQPAGLLFVGISVVLGVILGCAGVAIMLRWRGWRIWAGTISWGWIVMFVLNLFAPSSTNGVLDRVVGFMFLTLAVFTLVAKRWERKPNLAAVFDG